MNLSPRQLLDPGLPSRVERLLNAHDLRAERLGFEVTEAVVITNVELAIECLNRLRGLGCTVGLDDVDADPQAARIAETLVNLARTLSLTTIAEGVERQRQADVLNAAGCHYGQGWLFGRPAPA